ncbi:hypothetical protein E143388_07736 [Rhodococcus opacus]|nr:hypothetical protein E143388_07736 [Rhodococcus opacus]
MIPIPPFGVDGVWQLWTPWLVPIVYAWNDWWMSWH